MFILKKGHQPGVYVPLRALFLVSNYLIMSIRNPALCRSKNKGAAPLCDRADTAAPLFSTAELV